MKYSRPEYSPSNNPYGKSGIPNYTTQPVNSFAAGKQPFVDSIYSDLLGTKSAANLSYTGISPSDFDRRVNSMQDTFTTPTVGTLPGSTAPVQPGTTSPFSPVSPTTPAGGFPSLTFPSGTVPAGTTPAGTIPVIPNRPSSPRPNLSTNPNTPGLTLPENIFPGSRPGLLTQPTMPISPTRPTMPGTSTMPGRSTMPGMNTMPGMSTLPGTSTMPGRSTIPGMNTMPGMSTMPGMNTMPGRSTMPGTGTPVRPTMPSIPTAPTRPTIPSAPGTTSPTAPTIPGFTTPTMPTTPFNQPGITLPTGYTVPAAPVTTPATPVYTLPALPTIPYIPDIPSVPGDVTMPGNNGNIISTLPNPSSSFPGTILPTVPPVPGFIPRAQDYSDSEANHRDEYDYSYTQGYSAGNIYLTDMSPYHVPLAVPMMPLYGYDNCEDAAKDFDYIKQLYPKQAKMMLSLIEEECDKLEYDGSCMFDEYPDRVYLSRLVDKIYTNLNTVKQSSVNDGTASDNTDWLKDMTEVLLYNEMLERRKRYRGRKRWF